MEDGLEGREVSRHFKPEKGKEEAYPQDPPGMGS